MQYLLVLTVNVLQSEIALMYKYPAISEPFAHAVASTFREISMAVGKHSDVRLGEMESTSQNDRQAMVSWNPSNPFASTENWCMHHLVEAKAREIPSAEAVYAWDGSMTYADLVTLADFAAQRLVQAGVGPGVYVPFAYEKSMWVVVATLAILKAGGAFVPVNPNDPVARLTEIFGKVSAVVVVTMEKFVPKFSSIAEKVIVISRKIDEKGKQDKSFLNGAFRIGETPNSCPRLIDPVMNHEYNIGVRHSTPGINSPPLDNKNHSIKREVNPFDPMVVLFTSGSTGQPKGIILEHSAICTHALVHGSNMKYHGARVLQFAAHTFDVATIDIFTTLLFSGCICIPSEEERKSDVVGVISRMRADYAILTPSFAGLIDPSEVPTMKTLAIGGEALPQDRVQRWAEKVNLIQIYGPAEVGICLTMDMKFDTAPETVGFPLRNSSCWLVDPDNYNALVPIGAIGELAVAGPSLARGYLNNQAKTRVSFIEKPAWAAALGLGCERFYLTGDLLRYNTSSFDGSYDILGRKDAQIKLRGQRVEPAEIEYHVGKLSGVAVSMVTRPRKGYFAEDLVCVVQMHRPGFIASQVHNEAIRLSKLQTLTTRSLREQLAKVLPTYMIPSICLVIDTMPLVASLKIDRRQVDSWLTDLDTRPVLEDITTLSQLLPSELTAIALSLKISSLVASKDERRRSALDKHDFGLQMAGIDSIQIISLSMYLQCEHATKIPMDTLLSPDLTVRTLAKLIDAHNHRNTNLMTNGNSRATVSSITCAHIDVAHEAVNLTKRLFHSIQLELKSPKVARNIKLPKSNIFLTGATGYLGSTILRRLMATPNIAVFVLVRCSSLEVGFQRIVAAATRYKWWQPSYSSRIRVWVGDLIKPSLGLDPDNLRLLQGSTSDVSRGSAIHGVIHNGARIHYVSSYATLFPSNINPTLELLRITASSPHISKFIFVSGGLKPNASLSATSSPDMKFLREAGGYAQTKFVSETLVHNCVSHPAFQAKTLQIVKPGYIIGSTYAGVANTSDFIWRLIAGCIEIGAYNIEEADDWVFIADVEEVAHAVVARAFEDKTDDTASKMASSGHARRILSGLRFSDLWTLLHNRFRYRLQGVAYEEWMTRLRAKILESQDTHLLFPLLHVLERDGNSIGENSIPQGQNDTNRVMQAVERNVRYLIDTGFLPQSEA